MADVTNELLLETLKKMQDRDARIERKIDDLVTELRGRKEHQAGFMRSELAQDSRISDILVRLERVEARLELRD